VYSLDVVVDVSFLINAVAVTGMTSEYYFLAITTFFVGAKLQATNRVPRPVDRGTATRYGG